MKLFVISLLFTVNLSAQDLKISVDKITGDTTLTTGLEKLYSKASLSGTVGEQLKVATSKFKSSTIISIWMQTGKFGLFTVEKAIIKLQNGTVINLLPLTADVAEYSEIAYGGHGYSHYKPSDTDIANLLQSPVSIIRIETSRQTMDYEIKEKFSATIKDQLNKIQNK